MATSPQLEAKFDLYEILLNKWQRAINLVSPSTLPQARTRHLDDSAQLAPFIPEDAKILYDLGSGAGFPGLVLAMIRPDLSVHLIESDQRKGTFLQTVSRETDTPIHLHTARIEKVHLPAPDVITARALTSLVDLLRLTEKWWADWPACRLIFPKGAAVDDELSEAKVEFEFALQMESSITDPKARILILTDVRKRL